MGLKVLSTTRRASFWGSDLARVMRLPRTKSMETVLSVFLVVNSSMPWGLVASWRKEDSPAATDLMAVTQPEKNWLMAVLLLDFARFCHVILVDVKG